MDWPNPHEDLQLLYERPAVQSDDVLLRRVRATFHILIVGEIRRILVAPDPPGIAPAILGCCAIDFLGTLLTGQSAGSKAFLAFAKRFLKPYNPEHLLNLRHRLVHNYVMPSHYVLIRGRDVADRHLTPTDDRGERAWLVVEAFIDDIVEAGESLFLAAREPGDVRTHVLKRTRKTGLLMQMGMLPVLPISAGPAE